MTMLACWIVGHRFGSSRPDRSIQTKSRDVALEPVGSQLQVLPLGSAVATGNRDTIGDNDQAGQS